MFILYAVIIGLLIGVATRGDARLLANVTFRWSPVILGGLLCQLVLFSDAVTERIGDLGAPIYVGSTVCVLMAVLRNARIPGLLVVAAGGISNLMAILANGGYMPASQSAMASLGKADPTVYSNSVVLSTPALEPLTDIFALPRWLPFANVFSIGDVLIGLGVMWAIVAVMHGQDRSSHVSHMLDSATARLRQVWARGAPVQLTLVTGTHPTSEPLAAWDSRRSVQLEGHMFFRWSSVQGKPVVRRGTQS